MTAKSKARKRKKRPQPPPEGYLAETRAPLHALLALAPLVVLHAALVWLFQPEFVSLAAAWVNAPFVAAGLNPFQAACAVAAGFIVVALLLTAKDLRERRVRLKPSYVLGIWFEGCLWGLLLHVLLNGLPSSLHAPPADGMGHGDRLVLALGAGIYEELLFRVGVYWLVVRGITWVAKERLSNRAKLGLAVLLTSLLFALAHHLGTESASLDAILFRTAAALLLTGLLALRGLGVVACAHAFYDVVIDFL